MKKFFLSVIALCLFAGCSSSKTIKFSEKQDEVYTTNKLSTFLAENKSPKVVLRITNTSTSLTEDENVSYLFSSIENQLLASGFVVRDRQLFNQIIGNNNNNIDYKKIGEQSDTDLIIELTKLDPSIVYETNSYFDKNNEERVEDYGTHERFGASVEFKVVTIKNNEYAGTYKFNYAPCISGCVVSKSFKELQKEAKKLKKEEKEPYEGVEQDELEVFIKNATKRLMAEMRS